MGLRHRRAARRWADALVGTQSVRRQTSRPTDTPSLRAARPDAGRPARLGRAPRTGVSAYRRRPEGRAAVAARQERHGGHRRCTRRSSSRTWLAFDLWHPPASHQRGRSSSTCCRISTCRRPWRWRSRARSALYVKDDAEAKNVGLAGPVAERTGPGVSANSQGGEISVRRLRLSILYLLSRKRQFQSHLLPNWLALLRSKVSFESQKMLLEQVPADQTGDVGDGKSAGARHQREKQRMRMQF